MLDFFEGLSQGERGHSGHCRSARVYAGVGIRKTPARPGVGLPENIIPLIVSLIEAALIAWAASGVAAKKQMRAMYPK